MQANPFILIYDIFVCKIREATIAAQSLLTIPVFIEAQFITADDGLASAQ